MLSFTSDTLLLSIGILSLFTDFVRKKHFFQLSVVVGTHMQLYGLYNKSWSQIYTYVIPIVKATALDVQPE